MPGYTFKKIPTFGWFATNGNIVWNVYDFLSRDKWEGFYYWCTEHPELLDSKLDYHEHEDGAIFNSYMDWSVWQSVFNITHNALHNEDYGRYRKEFTDGGYDAGLLNNIGLMTTQAFKAITAQYPDIDLPVTSKNKFIIPTWASPRMICSLEIVSPQDFNRRTQLYACKEYGWYGDIDGVLLNSINDLTNRQGFTWNDKCLFWKDNFVVSEELSLCNLMQLWAVDAPMEKDPLDIVVENNWQNELETYLTLFKSKHITAIFEKTGIDLRWKWTILRTAQTTIGNKTFVSEGDIYKLHISKNNYVQITNFVIVFDKVCKAQASSTHHGVIHFNQNTYPFTIDSNYLRSPRKFSEGIRGVFMDYNIGVPIINPSHENKLLTIVSSFNQDTPIEYV